MTKVCKLCKLEKRLNDFKPNGNSTGDGRDPRCTACVAEYLREWKAKRAKGKGKT